MGDSSEKSDDSIDAESEKMLDAIEESIRETLNERPSGKVSDESDPDDDLVLPASGTGDSGGSSVDDSVERLDDEREEGQRVGERLSGRYDLTDFIERGAMGEVYKAEHALMKKTVAVKILHSDVTGQGKIVERFRREAQAAANIDHPNVCVATDFGRTDSGDFFLVMEFLEGRTLQETIDEEGPFETERALHIANQIASALVRAHAVGVIHRDLKPANIMLVDRGEDTDFVKILDFGIARVRMSDETPELTKTGAVFGTPSYMSPEQAAGDPVDHRTDLYALGNVLFQMLTGRRVFEADRGAQVMAMHVSKAPPDPNEFAPQPIDRELEVLISELLEKDPDLRPQTAKKLQERLLGLERFEVDFAVGSTLEPASVSQTFKKAHEEDFSHDLSMIVTRSLDAMSGFFKRHGPTSRWAALGLLGVVLGMGVTLAVTLINGGQVGPKRAQSEIESKPLSLDDERRAFVKHPKVNAAMKEYVRGAYNAAIDILEGLKGKRFEKNAHLEYLLGRSHAASNNWAESLAHFEKAMKIDPRYIRDRRVLNDILDALGSTDDAVVKKARKIIEARLDYDILVESIGRTAWRDSSRRTRERAYALLKDKKLLGKLPKWTQYAIQLRKSDGCSAHRKEIDKLVKLGDPRGLEILEIYDAFPERGCGKYKNRDCFGCIRKDIAEAIETLRKIDEGDG